MCWRLGTNVTYKSLQSICVCVFYKKRSAKNFFLHIITRDPNFSNIVFDRQYFDNNFDTTWRFNSLLFQNHYVLMKTKRYSYTKIQQETRIQWLDWWIVRKQLDIMPTYHYAQNQGKLMMQSRENDQKPQFRQFFLTISRSNTSKLQIFLKNRLHSNWRSYLVITSGQKPKKLLEPFLRKIPKCLILG